MNFYPRPPRGGRRVLSRAFLLSLNISIHALREEGDNVFDIFKGRCFLFLSTPSARRATARVALRAFTSLYFYPRPPRGGRLAAAAARCCAFVFLSTPSARRATVMPSYSSLWVINFYPRPPRGGRRTIPVFSPGV